MTKKPAGERIQSIDALRGLCVVLMCIHHLLYDIAAFLGAPWWIFTNPVLDVLHYLFAGCFIFLSGVSSRFSRSNIRRGLKLLVIALLLTLVTRLGDFIGERFFGEKPGIFISFGVLHLLSLCMLFYGLTRRLWDRLPRWLLALIALAGIIATAKLVNGIVGTESRMLFPVGLIREDFYSADYFPLFPWIFVFLGGTLAGGLIRERRFPEKFYTAKFRFFPAVGRHALLIYILHQPVLAGLTVLAGVLTGILQV